MNIIQEIQNIKKQLHKLWCLLKEQPIFNQDNIPKVRYINILLEEGEELNNEVVKATKVKDAINALNLTIQEREIYYFLVTFVKDTATTFETYIVKDKGKGTLTVSFIGELAKLSRQQDIPVIDGNSKGTGVPLYRGLLNKKIDIASL